MKQILTRLYYSFAIRLVMMHLQKNTMLLGVWVFITLLLTGLFGRSFGVMYLFLDPEYMGKVSFWSFAFMGFGFGGFLMVWNITTYILNSFRFPFLASINRPFFKYCINNALLPLLFLFIYFLTFLQFQIQNEFAKGYSIVYYISGFLVGFMTILIATIVYFTYTNQNIFKFIKKRPAPAPGRPLSSRRKTYKLSDLTTWRVDFYINEFLKIRRTREVRHYSPDILMKVFKQHHYNSFVFQATSFLSIIFFAYMMDHAFFRIPAGASILLLCTFVISLIGLVKYWLRSWRVVTFISMLLFINYMSSLTTLHSNKAYGLNYKTTPANYAYTTFDSIASYQNFQTDSIHTVQILNNWKKKNTSIGIERPQMIIVSSSGGGLRAAVWTTRVLQQLDSISNGRFFDNTALMTGASGGMLSTAYMRDVYWEHQKNPTFPPVGDSSHFQNMAADLQNSVAFSIAVNDLFVPWIGFEAEGYSYTKDRGYAFERQLKENLKGLLSKRLGEYQAAEQVAEIPMMFITPTISNDARRFIISPQKVAYMMKPPHGFRSNTLEVDGIDFMRFFEKQSAENLRLSSALRMNATYPYILPNVVLPTEPVIEAIDAGWRDNYGFDSALRFVNVFRSWIQENTSGVLLVQIQADERRDSIISKSKGLFSRLLNPLGAVGQTGQIQDYDQDEEFSYLSELIGKENIQLARFEYAPSQLSESASMSWHLTTRERLDIEAAIYLEHNIKSCNRIHDLLLPPKVD